MNFGAGATANYLSSFGSGVPDPRSLQLPDRLLSNAFTIGLGAIPQANLQAAVNTLSPIAQIGATAKAEGDLLAMREGFARRRDRLRMAGDLMRSMDFATGTGNRIANTALANLQQVDPRTDYLAQLNYEQGLRTQLGNATARSGAMTTAALQRLRGES